MSIKILMSKNTSIELGKANDRKMNCNSCINSSMPCLISSYIGHYKSVSTKLNQKTYLQIRQPVKQGVVRNNFFNVESFGTKSFNVDEQLQL